MQIYRNHNVLNDQDDLEHLYTFESFPVFMGCTASDNSHDLFCDLSIYISKSTGVLQINPILPLEVIYQAAHNSGSIGNIWQQHHMAFADFVRYQHPTAVLEIGGGHGKLSSIYREDIEWTIMEPNPKLVEGSSVRIIKEFFTEDTDLEQCKFDTIVHSHLFEHVHHPDQFVKLMSESLEVGGKVIFSVPNMRKMLEKKFTNCLNFEHTYFLSEEYITYLMSKHGFKILAQEYFMEDNSIFYAWEKTSSSFEMPLPANLYIIYKNLFLESRISDSLILTLKFNNILIILNNNKSKHRHLGRKIPNGYHHVSPLST